MSARRTADVAARIANALTAMTVCAGSPHPPGHRCFGEVGGVDKEDGNKSEVDGVGEKEGGQVCQEPTMLIMTQKRDNREEYNQMVFFNRW
jgi:hypothetical protein